MTAKLTPVPSEEEIRAKLPGILAQYGLRLRAAETRRKIWLLQTSQGKKYLKLSRLTAVDLRFIEEALDYLHSRFFTATPRFARTLAGEPFARESGRLFILTDWIDSAELNFRSQADLRDAARFLAKFHLFSRGFAPQNPHYRTGWLDWPLKLAARIAQLEDFRRMALAEKETSPFSRLYLSQFEHFYRQAVQSHVALLASAYRDVALVAARSMSLCHHDYSDRNLLRTPAGDIYLVDFDYCCRDLRIHDLINFMTRLLKHRNWEIDFCRLILREYQGLAALAPEEIAVMLILLQWPQDFWQVGLQYYYEKLPWPAERFLGKLESKVKSHAARERFLREFPCENGICRL